MNHRKIYTNKFVKVPRIDMQLPIRGLHKIKRIM